MYLASLHKDNMKLYLCSVPQFNRFFLSTERRLSTFMINPLGLEAVLKQMFGYFLSMGFSIHVEEVEEDENT